MDATERIAEQYLLLVANGNLVFEPDGNVPPDFAIDGRIAVEVRRLNQNYEYSDGKTQGLEEIAIPLWQRFKRYLPTLGHSIHGECWYVGMDYQRPLESWSVLQPKIEEALKDFMSRPVRTQCSIKISHNFEIDLIRSGKDHGSLFVLGASSDGDSGGLVMAEVERNLRICLAEKEKKIARFRDKYDEWWLLLVDHIDYGMEPEDRIFFKSEVMPRIPHSFRKIIFVSPLDCRHAFEI